MMTEAGKIQGVCWAFGSMTGYEHLNGNYAVENPKVKSTRLGTDVYKTYMEWLTKKEPQVFVQKHELLPEALKKDELHKLNENPELAAHNYIRQKCQRCHHAGKGRQKRGDFRGMGCSSCHIPNGNEGFYEGVDPSVKKDEPGHALVHSIQGTREAKVTVHGTSYSGIPVETCTTCHVRGKRIGVSFQGLMETPFASPYAADGGEQPALHTKQGHVIDKQDGFLLTARGNPYENVVRDGNEIIVHTAAGKDLRMKPLKTLFEEMKVSPRGVVAMQGVATHMKRMECYTCRSSWTPQCFGCHVKIDFSQKDKCAECNESQQGFDWVAAGRIVPCVINVTRPWNFRDSTVERNALCGSGNSFGRDPVESRAGPDRADQNS